MRYGYATGFATHVKDRVDDALLPLIQRAGFDYVEFPLMLLATQPMDEIKRVAKQLQHLQLGADCSCNMFPGHLRLTGPQRDWKAAEEYLEGAFERLEVLGTRKVVFGSSGARNLPEGTGPEEGYQQVAAFVSDVVVPLVERYDLLLAMEPIGGYEANFINTLEDGMRVVRAVNHPRVRLLADSVHMLYEQESPDALTRYQDFLVHIHICEAQRALPVQSLSPGLQAILAALKATGYDQTLSFEPLPYGLEDMTAALQNVKRFLEA